MKIVIIGGVAGGASAAARLRRLHEDAEIVLLERGPYISFANCGLPYYIGDAIQSREALELQTPESFHAWFRVDVRVMSEALSIDREEKNLTVRNLQTGEAYQESYDKLILSPGARPIRPLLPGVEDERVFTLRDIPDAVRLKEYIAHNQVKHALVVGGGYIGIEMAENLYHAGCRVTIVELADHILAPFDYDVAVELHAHLRDKGVNLRLGEGVASFHPSEKGIQAKLQTGETLDADLVFLSVGVRPEGELASAAGLEVTDRGLIVTNDRMQTSDEDIYAVGDAVQIGDFVTGQKGFVPLAGPANKQGRIAADNICGIPTAYTGTQGTSILQCLEMTAACTGINERTAKLRGLDYEKSFTYSGSHAGYYPGATSMSIKLVFGREDGKLLGAQIVGRDGVDKRIDVLATAIRAGMTVEDLTHLELAYAPPFSSAKDPVNMAGYTAQNILKGLVRPIHWHEVAELNPEEAVWLDVRTPEELRYNGKILEWAIAIPVDELRDRLEEVPKGKPVYVNCHSGLRSYIACRILAQKSFDCYNLSGGWRLYHLAAGNQ